VLFPTHPLLFGMPSHYPSEMLRPLAHSSSPQNSNHSILTHSSPNLNIRHLATARASDSSYMLEYVARYKFLYVCMYVCMPNTHRRRRRDSTVELSCIGGVSRFATSWRQFRQVWTNLPPAKSSCVVLAVWTHQFTLFPVLLSYWGWWQDDIMTSL